jgi:NADPH-dependent 2,4-dienoyl-CoA reductase/sulfur reductase-like enzyme
VISDEEFMNPRKYVIVGCGVAGLSAAESIRKHDPSGRIVMITEDPHGFYSRPGLAYVLNGLLPEDQIRTDYGDTLEAIGVETVVEQVKAVQPEVKRVALNDGQMAYDTLLLAVGARAVLPEIPGIHSTGVVRLDNLDDLKRILRSIRRARSAVVIGGGITALELAEGFAARKLRTHYLLRRDRYWPSVLDEYESRLVESKLIEEGIRLHHRTEVMRIVEKRGRVHAVETKAGETIECQLVGVAIGIRPRLDLARSARLNVDRGILVDEFMQSSVEGIYAAGDVAQVYDPVSGEHRLDSLWWVARQQGEIAGANMAGGGIEYHKPVAFNVTHIGGLTTTLIGAIGAAEDDEDLVSIVRGESETWQDPTQALASGIENHDHRIRLRVGERHIVGALVLGDQTVSRALQELIGQKVDISTIRQRLIENPKEISTTIMQLWHEWRQDSRASSS